MPVCEGLAGGVIASLATARTTANSVVRPAIATNAANGRVQLRARRELLHLSALRPWPN